MTGRVVIVGGGIGGLAAALALLARGVEAVVLEQVPELREVGAGVQLSPNAMRVLAALGVDEAVRALAVAPEALEMRDGRSGARLFAIPAGAAMERRYGAPYLNILRADLHRTLAEALSARAPGALRLGRRGESWLSGPDGVEVVDASGDRVEGAVLIAADGLHSRFREAVAGPVRPVYTGHVAWRTTAPAEGLAHPPPSRSIVWAGPGRHAVTYFVAGGRRLNFVGVVETPERDLPEDWFATGAREDLARAFQGWAAPVTDAITAGDPPGIWPLYEREAPARWVRGRLALLGDACHPMPPFLAQGAAMALEDALGLARMIADTAGSPEARLIRYEQARRARVRRVAQGARANARLFHLGPPPLRFALHAAMRAADVAAPAFIRSRQDWLYGFDPAV